MSYTTVRDALGVEHTIQKLSLTQICYYGDRCENQACVRIHVNKTANVSGGRPCRHNLGRGCILDDCTFQHLCEADGSFKASTGIRLVELDELEKADQASRTPQETYATAVRARWGDLVAADEGPAPSDKKVDKTAASITFAELTSLLKAAIKEAVDADRTRERGTGVPPAPVSSPADSR